MGKNEKKKDCYFEVLEATIKKLIIQRSEAHGNPDEQKRINIKLDKLYDIKLVMLQQQAKVVA